MQVSSCRKFIVIKEGDIILLSSGEYSDYTVRSVCRAKKDFDKVAIIEEYLALYPDEKKDYEFNEDHFIKWLVVDKDLLEEINYAELHIYSYHCFDWDSIKGGLS